MLVCSNCVCMAQLDVLPMTLCCDVHTQPCYMIDALLCHAWPPA